MTIANKYIQQCKSLFPVYGKLERTFFKSIKSTSKRTFRFIS